MTAEEWACGHNPRCADSACSNNPAIQRWIRGEPNPPPVEVCLNCGREHSLNCDDITPTAL